MKTDRNKRGKFCRSNNKGSYDELKVMRQKRWIFEHDRPPDIIKCIPLDDNVNRVPCSEHNYCSGSDMPIADESQDLISRQVEIPHEECRNIPNEDNSWRTGRRIVELGALAEGLAGCKLCGNPLHLTNCLGERKFGLAHILLVKCNFPSCRLVNDVPTGRKHRTDRGGNAWDVNTKLAAGMINGGFGETHVSSLLAALNIPSITHRNLKSREREVGAHLQLMAEESCKKHLEEEANL
ncbi:uncharacterized protein [Argopecten irradians]|uniref:uncharacterized protein n=1 Tax=Argopecten irradians TaxID=31199 RepID=UPI00371C7856